MSKIKFICFLLFMFIFTSQSYGEWKTSASTMEPEYPPNNAIDGDMSTRWSSKFLNDQWWMVDFGESMEIDRISLCWENAYTKKYAILVSMDGNSWEEIYSTKNGKGGSELIKIEPVLTRYVKIMLYKRATKWGNSLWEVKFSKYEAINATASSGQDTYSAESAVDGDMKTRWSSNFSDNEWWKIEFENPKKICGLTIHWETAFGEIYNIEVAGENGKFKKVYETKDGDGNKDIIYFEPIVAKTLRFNGIQRGTGWGFSFWEIEFYDGGNPQIITASDYMAKSEPKYVLDGNRTSTWHSENKKQSQITIKLPRKTGLGGLILTWGEDYAKSYNIEFSTDGTNWKKIFETDSGNGKVDWAYFSPKSTNQIRINCLKSGTKNGYALAEIELKSSGEKATPIKIFQASAKTTRPGLYLMWLRRIQEFWTVTGVDKDLAESLFTETGSFEPYKDSYSVMPFIFEGNKTYTSEDCKVSQNLVDNSLPIPTVKWQHKDDWDLNITTFAIGKPGESNSIIRYQFQNNGKKTFNGKLALAILPVQVNPIWQHGGISKIKNVDFVKENECTVVKINRKTSMITLNKPTKMGAMTIQDGDIIDFIKKQTVPKEHSIRDKKGLASCGLLYNLKVLPGNTKDIIVVFPLHRESSISQNAVKNPTEFYNEQLEIATKQWDELINNFVIEIPEKRLIDVMKSNIAYILINKDGPWIKPGSRNYNHSWVRDGAMTIVTLLRMGFIKEVREWLESVTPHITKEGNVPYIFFEGGHPVGFNPKDDSGEGKEYDSQGQYVFAVRQYVDYTGDIEFLQGVYSKTIHALRFAQELRRKRMTDEYKNNKEKQPYYGIIPQSNSHEGYYPAMHSYWDDFWVLRGFKDGLHLAKLIGKNKDVKWLQKEIKDFRKCLYDSIINVAKRDKIDYISGCVEKGDYDPTSTAIAIMACDELDHLPQPYLKNTFDTYFKGFKKRLIPGGEDTFTPYEVRSADAFIRMGERERALVMFRYFLKDSVRPFDWNHMGEVVHARVRAPSYIGDMPHTWVGSGYVNAVRTIFVYEHEDKIVIGAGIDPAWLNQGVLVKDLPTQYGKINYTMKQKDEVIEFNISGEADPPAGFVIPLPKEFKDYKITSDDKSVSLKDGKIYFSKLPVMIKIQ